MTMKTIPYDGKTLEASWHPNPGKPGLIFIHGAGGASSIWLNQKRRFKADFAVAAVNLSGHGKSEKQAKPDIAEYARQVLAVADALEMEKPTLVGHSMGGGVTLRLALDRPDRFRAAVLAGSGARLKVHPVIFQLMDSDPKSAVEYMVNVSFGADAPSLWKTMAMKEMSQTPIDVFRHDFEACCAFDVMDRIGEVSLPAAAIVGDQDKLTPVKYSEFLRDRMPDCRLEVIPNAGHMVMIEQAEAFNGALESFLESLDKV